MKITLPYTVIDSVDQNVEEEVTLADTSKHVLPVPGHVTQLMENDDRSVVTLRGTGKLGAALRELFAGKEGKKVTGTFEVIEEETTNG